MDNDENKKKVKNILLLFLSNFNLNKAKTDLVDKLSYYGKNNYSVEARQTNEPAVYYVDKLCNDNMGHGLDKVFMFASKMIREQSPYEDVNLGEEPEKTHLHLFEQHVENQLNRGKLNNFFARIDYEEPEPKVVNRKPMPRDWNYDKNENDFIAACDMAKMIQTYCKYPDKTIETIDDVNNILSEGEDELLNKKYKIKLYVDMTGGFRHANMLMLAVIDLLEHDNIEVCDIIYSNLQRANSKNENEPDKINKDFGKIEEVTNIYNVFQLVAGVEEFTKYGSVEILEEYFKNVIEKNKKENSEQKISEGLKELIASMKSFSETLMFCRSGKIKENMIDLKNNIDKYFNSIEQVEKFTEEEKVFRILLSTIGNKYKDIFNKNENDKTEINYVYIIRWCMDNEYYQQAITFFTELVPIYIFNDGILCVNNCDDYVKEKKFYAKNSDSWQKALLKYYRPHKNYEKEKMNENMIGNSLNYDDPKDKYKNDSLMRRILVEHMIDDEILKTDYKTAALNIVESYNRIAILRNTVNHAGDEQDSENIKLELKNAVEKLEKRELVKKIIIILNNKLL